MVILLKISGIIFLTSILNFFVKNVGKYEFLKQDDTRWDETICVPTYGAWGTIEGCRLNANVSPYDEPRDCWVYMGGNEGGKEYCSIIFSRPMVVSLYGYFILYYLLFMILNIFGGGYPFLLVKILINFFTMIILTPICLVLEIRFIIFDNDLSLRSRFRLVFKFLGWSLKNIFLNFCGMVREMVVRHNDELFDVRKFYKKKIF